jgi:hypothetical protein
MSSSQDRLKWAGIVCSFIIVFALYSVFIDEEFVGGPAERYRDEDASNRDSLLVLWEDGGEIAGVDGLDADFRLATIGIGLLLFVSIFSTLIIHFSNGGKIDE